MKRLVPLAALLLALPAAAAGKPVCKKHIVVTFAVYHQLIRNEVVSNGCWVPELTVQEPDKYRICHPPHGACKGAGPVAIYDDINPADKRNHPNEAAAIARMAAPKEVTKAWEYLTPHGEAPIANKKLERVYYEAYDSARGGARFLAQWRARKRINGHTLWPMIDVSQRQGTNAEITKMVESLCKEIGDHGVIGLYGGSPITRAPRTPAEKKTLCKDAQGQAQCNGRLQAILAALDACTR